MEHLDHEIIAQYISGQLDSLARRAITQHLSSCETCREKLMSQTTQNFLTEFFGLNTQDRCLSGTELIRYLRNEIPSSMREYSSEHIRRCRKCKRRLKDLQRVERRQTFAPAHSMPKRQLGYALAQAALSVICLLIILTPYIYQLKVSNERLAAKIDKLIHHQQILLKEREQMNTNIKKFEIDLERIERNVRLVQSQVGTSSLQNSKPVSSFLVSSAYDRAGIFALTSDGQLLTPPGIKLDSYWQKHVKALLLGQNVKPLAHVQRALSRLTVQLPTVRGTSGQSTFMLIAPKATAIRSIRPVFHWQPVPQAKKYRVVLADQRGAIIDAYDAGTRHEFTLPSTAPQLQYGQIYQWQVEATVNGSVLLSEPARFWILPKQDIQAVMKMEKRFPYSLLILYLTYSRYGLNQEANAILNKMSELNKGAPWLPHPSQASLQLQAVPKRPSTPGEAGKPP